MLDRAVSDKKTKPWDLAEVGRLDRDDRLILETPHASKILPVL